MGIIRNIKSEYTIYENQELGVLVAIPEKDSSLIKSFFKEHKNKKDLPKDKIKGYPFILDEEFDSLKIDFSALKTYEIRHLSKFKG